jgi:hypothetical protein
MRSYQYTGTFRSAEGHIFTLDVICNGFLQAFILLTADAIRKGNHYQLDTIESEDGGTRKIDDICKLSNLIQ